MKSSELRQLLALDWTQKYLRSEAAIKAHHREVMKMIVRLERRARLSYRDILADFDVDEDGRVVNSSSRVSRSRRAISAVYGSSLRVDGDLRRLGRRNIEEMADLAFESMMEHREAFAAIDGVFTGISDHAVPVAKGSASSRSRWAFDRDVEQLKANATHRAALGIQSSQAGGSLATGMRDASRSTKISRRSVLNTFGGTERHAVRATIHDMATRSSNYSTWMAIPTVRGGLYGLKPRTEKGWGRLTRRNDGWSVGNAVSGFGLHVGSKTYFAPVPLRTDALAAEMSILFPNSKEVIEKLFRVRSESRLTVFPFGSKEMTVTKSPLKDFADVILGPLNEAEERIQKISKRPKKSKKQITIGKVLLATPKLIAIDNGFTGGSRLGDRFNVIDDQGFVKSQIEIIQSFPKTSNGFRVYTQRGAKVQIGDRVVELE